MPSPTLEQKSSTFALNKSVCFFLSRSTKTCWENLVRWSWQTAQPTLLRTPNPDVVPGTQWIYRVEDHSKWLIIIVSSPIFGWDNNQFFLRISMILEVDPQCFLLISSISPMEELRHHLGWLKAYINNGMFTTVFNWCRISQAHPQYGITPLDARADARAASGLFRVFAFLLAKRDQFLWESHGTRGGPVSLSLLVYKLIISI